MRIRHYWAIMGIEVMEWRRKNSMQAAGELLGCMAARHIEKRALVISTDEADVAAMRDPKEL